ncbi:MAG: hypothetical protein WBO58_02130 [Gammaproteobacteria bacterium]
MTNLPGKRERFFELSTKKQENKHGKLLKIIWKLKSKEIHT